MADEDTDSVDATDSADSVDLADLADSMDLADLSDSDFNPHLDQFVVLMDWKLQTEIA